MVALTLVFGYSRSCPLVAHTCGSSALDVLCTFASPLFCTWTWTTKLCNICNSGTKHIKTIQNIKFSLCKRSLRLKFKSASSLCLVTERCENYTREEKKEATSWLYIELHDYMVFLAAVVVDKSHLHTPKLSNPGPPSFAAHASVTNVERITVFWVHGVDIPWELLPKRQCRGWCHLG